MNVDIAKNTLLLLQAELLERIEKIGIDLRREHDKSSTEQSIERENEEVLVDLNTEAENELSLIKRALTKIENGRYGFCEQCDQPINEDRLKIIAYAKFCENCMS
ncbi:TraR/DksA family transcriptional regulator [Aurantivibrio infirmus]